jgi:hypothetical protein
MQDNRQLFLKPIGHDCDIDSAPSRISKIP